MTRTIRILFLLAAPCFGVAPALAQTFDDAAASAKADLDKALAELATVQQQVAAERLPLGKRLNELEDAVLGKRREFDRIQRLRGSRAFDLENLKAEVKARRDENTYITSLLDEYVRAFETRVHISELSRYQAQVSEAKLALEDVNLSAAEKFERQVSLLRTELDRVAGLMGGEVFAGRALTPEGVLEEGEFALVGPIAIFASKQTALTGVSELRMGSIEPSVFPIGAEFEAGIRSVLSQKAGDLPVDPTLGSALKIAGTKETLLQHIRRGGPVMVPILTLAAAAALVGLFKWIQVSGVRLAKPEDLQEILELLNRGEKDNALARAARVKGPAGELLAAAVQNAHERKQLLEEILYEKLLGTKPRLERLLPFIAVTAATEPLLGLLGTVTGIIRTFKLITVFGTGDPRLLSSGISEALITTEFGLYFAIPSLLIHALLSRKVRGLIASMEQTAVGFINGLRGNRE